MDTKEWPEPPLYPRKLPRRSIPPEARNITMEQIEEAIVTAKEKQAERDRRSI